MVMKPERSVTAESGSPLLDGSHYIFGYLNGGFLATWRETGPVIEIYDPYLAVGRDDAVAAIDSDIKDVGRRGAQCFELFFVEVGRGISF